MQRRDDESEGTEFNRVQDDQSSQGTMIKRTGTATSNSKFSETSMLRVVEEDLEDENNYLRTLEEQQMDNRHSVKDNRPMTSTNDKQRKFTQNQKQSRRFSKDEDVIDRVIGANDENDMNFENDSSAMNVY